MRYRKARVRRRRLIGAAMRVEETRSGLIAAPRRGPAEIGGPPFAFVTVWVELHIQRLVRFSLIRSKGANRSVWYDRQVTGEGYARAGEAAGDKGGKGGPGQKASS
jgi:hypothetical protein